MLRGVFLLALLVYGAESRIVLGTKGRSPSPVASAAGGQSIQAPEKEEGHDELLQTASTEKKTEEKKQQPTTTSLASWYQKNQKQIPRRGTMLLQTASTARQTFTYRMHRMLPYRMTNFLEGNPKDPTAENEPKELWGLPKLVWVILANVLAMTIFLACIPIVLSCAKRKRPIFR